MNKTIWALAFVVLACGTAFAIDDAAATVGTQDKFPGQPTAPGNFTTEGGNVTDVDLEQNASTEKWAGIFGEVAGNLVLSDSTSTQYMYDWAWLQAAGGTVCASTNNAPTWASVAAAVAGDIDTAWGFTAADADSETSTMTGTGSVVINTATVGPSIAVTTYDGAGASTWQTVALKGLGGAAKAPFAFCVNIDTTGTATAFDNSTADYQVMVPTNAAANTFETYYFFVELS